MSLASIFCPFSRCIPLKMITSNGIVRSYVSTIKCIIFPKFGLAKLKILIVRSHIGFLTERNSEP